MPVLRPETCQPSVGVLVPAQRHRGKSGALELSFKKDDWMARYSRRVAQEGMSRPLLRLCTGPLSVPTNAGFQSTPPKADEARFEQLRWPPIGRVECSTRLECGCESCAPAGTNSRRAAAKHCELTHALTENSFRGRCNADIFAINNIWPNLT